MDRHFSTSVKEVSVPWVERQTLKTLGRFLPRAARERQIHEWQDQLECTRAVNGDLGRELMQMVRSTPSLAWTAVPSVFRVSLPPLATAIMAALILWPAGRTPLPAGNDYAVRLWDARTHKQLGAPLIGHTGPVMRVAFSRDGRTLASASEDGTVRLWDARTHKQIGPPLIDNIGPIRSLGFSADGRMFASASEDGTVRLWDARTHKPLGAPFTDNADPVVSIAFSPDGRMVASGIKDKTIRSWKKALWRRVAELRPRHSR